MKIKIKEVLGAARKDYVFMAALILAILSSIITVPKIKYIDFKVIISLFNLMIVVKAFEDLKLLDKSAVFLINKCKSKRNISLVLICMCFFGSMFITNDVALITFVPLSVIIGRKIHTRTMETIILQTLSANIGSSLTPMGNPQNLYIFSFYNISLVQFVKIMLPVGIIGFMLLYIFNLRLENSSLCVKLNNIKLAGRKEIAIWIFVFLVIISSVFRIIDYRIAFLITVLAALFMNGKLFKKVDYLLLITFICFFIFTGNISSIKSVNDIFVKSLKSSMATYFASIGICQVISNVPCSILLSHFTSRWRALLLGVDVGGIGTMIASLASIISYKLFIKNSKSGSSSIGREYISKFTIYNIITLVVLALTGIAII